MRKPFRYTIICNKTGRIVAEQNFEPITRDLQTWEDNELKQTKTAYIDTRYEARLRLYNYITYTQKGLEIPKYRPYKGTEIGKSVPILNF